MLKQGLVNIFNFKFSRGGDVCLEFWSKCLVEILKMKFDLDLCLNLWNDPIYYFGKMNSTLGSVVPLAMFSSYPGQLLCFFSKDYTSYLFLLLRHAQLLSFAGMNPSLELGTGISFIRYRSLYWDFTNIIRRLTNPFLSLNVHIISQHRDTWDMEKACPTPQASWSLGKRATET